MALNKFVFKPGFGTVCLNFDVKQLESYCDQLEAENQWLKERLASFGHSSGVITKAEIEKFIKEHAE